MQQHGGASIFEKRIVKTGEKRKRLEKGDPAVIDGYQGKEERKRNNESHLNGPALHITYYALGWRRRRERDDDCSFILGPWREYKDQVKVSCPTPEEMAIIEAQKGSKMKKKRGEEEEETIEENTVLHSKS